MAVLVPLSSRIAIDTARIIAVVDYRIPGVSDSVLHGLGARKAGQATAVIDCTIARTSLSIRRSVAITDAGQLVLLPWQPMTVLDRLSRAITGPHAVPHTPDAYEPDTSAQRNDQ